MFINLSNHLSANWGEDQLRAAREFGEVVDFPYPPVDENSTEEGIRAMVEDCLARVLEMKPAAIMVCGEFTFTFQMVDALLIKGVNVLTAVSGRDTVEVANPDGTTTKTSHFHFRGFRKYEYHRPLLHPADPVAWAEDAAPDAAETSAGARENASGETTLQG